MFVVGFEKLRKERIVLEVASARGAPSLEMDFQPRDHFACAWRRTWPRAEEGRSEGEVIPRWSEVKWTGG